MVDFASWWGGRLDDRRCLCITITITIVPSSSSISTTTISYIYPISYTLVDSPFTIAVYCLLFCGWCLPLPRALSPAGRQASKNGCMCSLLFTICFFLFFLVLSSYHYYLLFMIIYYSWAWLTSTTHYGLRTTDYCSWGSTSLLLRLALYSHIFSMIIS